MPQGNLIKGHLIAAPPALVQTVTADVVDFLDSLAPADFSVVADTKALWAVEIDQSLTEGTAGGTAYVVSAEAYKYVKAHRY